MQGKLKTALFVAAKLYVVETLFTSTKQIKTPTEAQKFFLPDHAVQLVFVLPR